MIAIAFEKTRAEHFIDCIKNGSDIKCMPKGWTQGDMLTLAGALLAAAYSQGAPLHQDQDELMSRPNEHREMIESQFTADLHGAIEFNSMLTFKVMDNEFDAQFEPSVTVFIEGSTMTVAPRRGFRESPDPESVE
jgi:hypothetical protein